MKTILIRNDLITGGGVENVMHTLVSYLATHNYDISVVTDEGNQEEFYSIYPSKAKYIKGYQELRTIKKWTLNWFIAIIKITFCKIYIKYIKKYDIAIAMKEGPSMQRIATFRAKKKFAWIHVDYRFLYWTKFCFPSGDKERECMALFDKVVCVSQAAADSVISTVGDPENVCVRYNPMDYKMIIQKAAFKSDFIRDPNKFLFVTVGRLDPQKNYLRLITICQELSEYFDFELWIIGEGKQRTKLEKKLNSSKFSCVKLLGQQDNPYPIMKIADCIVSASKWESYGLVIQEALVLGVPVVTTECPAIAEVFDPRFGLMAENTKEGLKNAMKKVLQYPILLSKYRTNINSLYKMEDLYDHRLKDICGLWR
nr:glycosyltransferase [uncultured Desulfobacter sp.]